MARLLAEEQQNRVFRVSYGTFASFLPPPFITAPQSDSPAFTRITQKADFS